MKKSFVLSFVFCLIIFCHSVEFENIRSFILREEYGKALDIINSKISEDSKNRVLYELRGDVFFQIEEYPRALEDYKKAYRLSFEKKNSVLLREKYNNVLDKLYLKSLSSFIKKNDFKTFEVNLPGNYKKNDFERINFKHNFVFQELGRKSIGPRAFCVSNNKIYVIDNMDYKICIFDNKGVLLNSFGEKGLSEGRLFRPVDIAASKNRIFVADMYRNILRIICYNDKSEFLWEKKIIQVEQINNIKVNNEILYISGVKDKDKTTLLYDMDGNLIGLKNTYYEDIKIESIKGNIIELSDNILKKVFELNYPDNAITRGLIYANKDFFILSVKVLKDKKEKEYLYEQIVYKIDYSGKIIKTLCFNSELFGNIDRNTKYFYNQDENSLYISNIEKNKFNVLKFRDF
ncbi:MAG: hypothetical protein M0R46_06115 [Candidatus Muirbacterium halophilum]|nr:hypothetical protein [Candidatus Muirbacterium halophilum]MCK9475469.1 hypothetical protein [Candidatus Muirbacterium halophilum]